MAEVAAEEAFRRWHVPWKERVCDEVRPCPHGTVFRSRRHPDFWEYNCVRLEEPVDAREMVALANRELAGCAHRFVEWLIPIPDGVALDLRARGWLITPLIYMLHDGRDTPEAGGAVPRNSFELREVDYNAVLKLREIWLGEDFGGSFDLAAFNTQARDVAELAGVRVIAAVDDDRLVGFAQVESHDGGGEVAQAFVRADHRGAGIGTALTARAIRVAAGTAPRVWICAERDDRPRRLYQRLGFQPVAETATAILLPKR